MKTSSAKQILRVSENRAELVRAMPSGSKMFYKVKELRTADITKSDYPMAKIVASSTILLIFKSYCSV